MNMPPTQGSGPSRHRRINGDSEIDLVNPDLMSWFDPANVPPFLPAEPRLTGMALFANGGDAETENNGHHSNDRYVVGQTPQRTTPVSPPARFAAPTNQTPRLHGELPQHSNRPIPENKGLVATRLEPSSHANPPIEPLATPEEVVPAHRRSFPAPAGDEALATALAVQASKTPPIPAMQSLPATLNQTEPRPQTRRFDNTVKGIEGQAPQAGTPVFPPAKVAGPPSRTTTPTVANPTRFLDQTQTYFANHAALETDAFVAPSPTTAKADVKPPAVKPPPAETRRHVSEHPGTFGTLGNHTLTPPKPNPLPISISSQAATHFTATQPSEIVVRETADTPSRSIAPTAPATANVGPPTTRETLLARVCDGDIDAHIMPRTVRKPPLKTIAAKKPEANQPEHSNLDPAGVLPGSAPSLPTPAAAAAATVTTNPAPSPSAQPAALLESWCAGITAALPAKPTGGATLRCHINLPNMPELAVQVRVEDGMLRLQLHTDDAATHRLLAEHLPDLRERLRDRLDQPVHLSLPKPGNPHADDDRPRDRRRQRRRGGQEQGSAS